MKYLAPKGFRSNREFLWIVLEGDFRYKYYYDLNFNTFLPINIKPENYSGDRIKYCRTVKAFKRFLRKNPQFIGHCTLVHSARLEDEQTGEIINLDVKG